MNDDFIFCPVRWPSGLHEKVKGEHICAEHNPLHTQHRCCCGSVEDAEAGPR